MDDLLINETAAALDRALAQIAMNVAGNRQGADELLASVGKGERSASASAFMSEAAAMMRARVLLADATRRGYSLRKRIAA